MSYKDICLINAKQRLQAEHEGFWKKTRLRSQVVQRKWNQESKKGKDTMQKLRIHSFTQQLLANITILSNQVFMRADCFLFPPLLQELEDSELAKNSTPLFIQHFPGVCSLVIVLGAGTSHLRRLLHSSPLQFHTAVA